jgi:protein BUR2
MHCNIEFPDQEDKPWWEIIGMKIEEIKKCCNYMALLSHGCGIVSHEF